MKLGISASLLEKNSFKKDTFIVNTLSNYFEYEPCFFDNTKKMDLLYEQIKDNGLCGFILNTNTSDCKSSVIKIKEEYPYLPIEYSKNLKNPWHRESFLTQIFAYKHLHNFLDSNPVYKDLVEFHTMYKYLILSKSTENYKELGSIVANHEKKDIVEVLEDYKHVFLEVINKKGRSNKTYNVLLHIFGYLKKQITKEEKSEILEFIEDYKEGSIPLIVVVNVLNLYVKKLDIEYLLFQKFLNPYPKELTFRFNIKALK